MVKRYRFIGDIPVEKLVSDDIHREQLDLALADVEYRHSIMIASNWPARYSEPRRPQR